MGQFQKGKSGNPGGRPKGSENKATGELRQIIAGLLQREFTIGKVKKMLDGMKSEDKLSFMIKLSEFILPKPKVVDANLYLSPSELFLDLMKRASCENDEISEEDGQGQED